MNRILQIPLVPLLLAVVAPSSAALQEADPEATPNGLWEALGAGRTWLNLRHRFEAASIDGLPKDADASTLRTALGYETGRYKGFRALLEFESISLVGDDNFNSTTNGAVEYPVVADPVGTEVNQVYLGYDGFDGVDVRLGRQEISLGNQRFVGAVPWRQNHQSFDALRVMADVSSSTKLDYSAVWNVNRIFGDQSTQGDEMLNAHFLNVVADLGEVGQGTAYGYLVDFDDNRTLSSNTFGARFEGEADLGEVKVGYVVEAAQQTDAYGNPIDLDADYRFLELAGTFAGTTLKLGSETLGGSGAPGDRFSTPFATLHKFNGFADVFLNTPDAGLEDNYVALSRSFDVEALPGPIKLLARYHVFSSDAGDSDYGTELDLNAAVPLSERIGLGLRYADFDADGGFADTTRFMAWLTVRVL